MKILAVDTSSKNCSVAIVEVDENNNFNTIIVENNDEEKTHSQKLMPIIDDVFKKSNLTLDDINLLVCCLGPGSFTGIRIGIATLKAFADVKNIGAVGVTSLESLAYNVTHSNYVVSLLDCKNENVYGGLFGKLKDSYTQLGENVADTIYSTLDNFITLLDDAKAENVTFVGDGSILYKDLIIRKFSENDNLKTCKLIFSDNNVQSSVSLAICGYIKFLQAKFGDSNNLSPVYLRKSQAERAKFEKQGD